MINRRFNGGGKTAPFLSDFTMTAPMIVCLLLFSVFPFVISLFSIDTLSILNTIEIFIDSSTRITFETSMLYALFSIIFTVNIGMRLAWRMYFSRSGLKFFLLSVLFLTWIIPSFIAVPLYRSIMYWFTDNLISSQLNAFLITTSARIWINIPLMTLISFAAIGQISKNQVEMMMTEGASKEVLYDQLFKPSIKNVTATFSLLLFINALRDLNIPIMMTNGRPWITEGFTSYGIAGSTTTFGLFLKDSLLRLNTDYITYTQSLFATCIILILFFCINQIRKGKLKLMGICLLIDFFFYTDILSMFSLSIFAVLYFLSERKGFSSHKRLLILLSTTILNSLFHQKITPGLICSFVFLFFSPDETKENYNFSFNFREKLRRIWYITGDMLGLLWLFISGAVFYTLIKLMFSNPLYIPEWNEFDHFTLQNFTTLFNNGFHTNLVNSILLGLFSAIIIVLIVFPVGYTTTIRKKFNRSITSLIFFSIAITGMNTIIPLFIMFREINLIDTFIAVILIIVNHSIPLAYLIITEDLKKISPSYFDTARLEGASHIQIFIKIVLPLIIPTTAVISLKIIVDGFSSFTAPLLFINSPEKFPVALRLFAYAGKDSLMYPEWGLFAAGSAIAIAILFALIFPCRRLMMKGIYRSWSDE